MTSMNNRPHLTLDTKIHDQRARVEVFERATRAAPDPFAEFAEYCRLRLSADPHFSATTLSDEVTALGYTGSYRCTSKPPTRSSRLPRTPQTFLSSPSSCKSLTYLTMIGADICGM